jgi:alkylation response protein AidB-like acyl-CoA dehydrogenase
MIELTTEQREIQEWAREFAARYVTPRALELDKNPESPLRDELLREAAKAGLFGNSLPEFLGGLGHDPLTGVLVTEELAAACSGCAVLFGASPGWPRSVRRSRGSARTSSRDTPTGGSGPASSERGTATGSTGARCSSPTARSPAW